ncbi:pyrroline-5-carboxylate reductase [Enterococcus hermanniensis]|uniref:Pyrroline-5-carboxylate reductase n=1 Tax=Enterococcus hermanniensis TaxID=249189 RepID=A0A1L8TKW0_9ENTE|nr:pyrroline-5-carboxylate reductase [Enterococcus hermanniensis]OJG44927.1 pyrroline-5-carboxylate reductase [Enterococcus hermanniensis]
MKIGFIGAGNMASAIIEGILQQNFSHPQDIYLYDISIEKAQAFAEKKSIQPVNDLQVLIQTVDAVVLAVKPNVVQKVLSQAKTALLENHPLIVSIAAGMSTEILYEMLQTDEAVRIVRVMPNMNAMVGSGAAAICKNKYATKEDLNIIIDLFNSVGKAWPLEEKYFSIFTAIAGSSPAYTFLFIDSIARAAVKNGMPKDLALEIATQAILGSAETLEASQENPWTLIDRISSPGGTTVAGIVELEDNAFISTVIKGIDATIQKDQELGEKN